MLRWLTGATPESRAGILRQRLEALVADVSKWVRPVARHSLGPFLATLKSEDISEGALPAIYVLCLPKFQTELDI